MALLRASVLVLVALFAAAGRGSAAVAAAERPSEHAVKAAFMFNFIKFVEWPHSAAERPRFTVVVLGEDPFGEVLERTFTGKKIHDRPIVIRRVGRLEEVGEADLLFVSSSESPRVATVLHRFEQTPVLTVGEMEDFIGRGGMVGFRLEEDVVRFDINLDRVWQARLKMSSQLVRVARKVISSRSGGS